MTAHAAIGAATPAVPLFYPGETARCPTCGGRHFLIGRSSVECVRCTLAMPLALPITDTVPTQPKED